MVLFFHAFGYSDQQVGNIGYIPLAKYGRYGVQIFFFLSGFVITMLISQQQDPVLFIKKRMARIYPTYWQVYFITISCWIVWRILLFDTPPFRHGSWFLHLSLMPFDMTTGKMVLGVAWTLFYEVFFYSVIAASLALFKNYRHGIYLFTFLTIFGKDFFQLMHFDRDYFFDFLVGYFFYEFLKDKNLIKFLPVLIYALIRDPIVVAFVASSMLFILILEYKSFENKILLKIGDASYSLYLIHFPLMGVNKMFLRKIESVMQGSNQFTIDIVLVIFSAFFIAGTIYLSIMNYEKFEKRTALKLKKYLI